ncbi:MAG TPA: hypothetical protein VF266_17230 [Thermoanaerobaculia bacterium]
MMDFTPEAKRKFDEYLLRMRVSMQGRRAVETTEVEQNVVEHVQAALAGVPSPVGPERLSEVLAQLGPPERWLPEDERPIWRRWADRFMTGPEDWRLAYISLALMVLAIVFVAVGGVLLVIPAYLVSRAYVEFLSDRGEPLGARKWLVLPPIVLLMVALGGAALFGPAGGFGAILSEVGLREFGWEWDSRADRMRIFTGMLSIATGTYWIVLSALFALLVRPFRALFQPLTANLRAGHAWALTAAGAIVAAFGATLLYLF